MFSAIMAAQIEIHKRKNENCPLRRQNAVHIRIYNQVRFKEFADDKFFQDFSLEASAENLFADFARR